VYGIIWSSNISNNSGTNNIRTCCEISNKHNLEKIILTLSLFDVSTSYHKAPIDNPKNMNPKTLPKMDNTR